MPLIEAAHRAFGAAIDVWAIGQDAEGNAKLVERYALTVPMLDDSALKVSFDYGLDTVPTIILADVNGHETRRFVGFGRDDWREMFAELARQSGVAPPPIDWNSYPESRPGCGSKSVEPGIAERLEAEARGDKMTARRIELGDAEDVFEFMFERGLTDGLPVVPPTPERVMWMLTGTRRDPREVVAIVPPNLAPRDGRESRGQCRDGRMQARIFAGGDRGARGGLHRHVQHPRHHVDDLGRDAGDRRQRSDSRAAST